MTEEVHLSSREIIDRYLRKRADGNSWHAEIFSKEGKRIYHPSAVGACHRKAIYERAKTPPDSPKPLGLFEMGRRYEAVLYEALVDHYGARFVRNDVPVREEFGDFVLVGESDPILFDWNLKPLIIYEAKSNGKGKDAVSATHQKQQGAWYADVLGAPEVRIVHASRDDVLDSPEQDTTLRGPEIRALAEATRIYFRRLNGAVKGVEAGDPLPEAKPLLENECRWCSFQTRCRTDGGWVEVERALTRGPRKGQIVKEWVLASEAGKPPEET